jgi:MFS family permease
MAKTPLVVKEECTNEEFPTVQDAMDDIRHTNLRSYVFALSCMLTFGCYFIYYIPSSLASQIIEVRYRQTYDINFLEISLLYSVYFFPNFVLPFFGERIVDLFGVRICICIFSSLVCLGQAIFAFSASITNYPVALVRRVVYGLGAECLSGESLSSHTECLDNSLVPRQRNWLWPSASTAT